jgi:hypothetical protein
MGHGFGVRQSDLHRWLVHGDVRANADVMHVQYAAVVQRQRNLDFSSAMLEPDLREWCLRWRVRTRPNALLGQCRTIV